MRTKQKQTGIRLTHAQRKVVADLVPDLSDSLLLETTNHRALRFDSREIEAILNSAKTAISHADNGVTKSSLRPELLDDGFDDFDCIDSTITMLRDIVPKTGKRFAFKYEYDFGDGWEHEILFEGSLPLEKGKKYPHCLDGERSCPPEDVGGVWGYAEYLEALSDPKHERHEEFKEWNGAFDPDKFDPKRATKEMKKGLPDWREMEDDF